MHDLKMYWRLPASDQQSTLDDFNEQEQQAALEKEACEKHLIIYKGQLVKPEDYPCLCSMESPDECYELRDEENDTTLTEDEIKDECCHCPCHTWYEPF